MTVTCHGTHTAIIAFYREASFVMVSVIVFFFYCLIFRVCYDLFVMLSARANMLSCHVITKLEKIWNIHVAKMATE